MRFFNILALLSVTTAGALATSVTSNKEEDAALEAILADAQKPEVIAAEEKYAMYTARITARVNEECSDYPVGWQDAMDDDCSYYEEHPEERCLMADAFKDKDGESADDVCCVCGGGVTPDVLDDDADADLEELTEGDEEEEDDMVPFRPMLGCAQCEDDENFEDVILNDCDYYAEHVDIRCPFAELAAVDGYDAKQACCACGGGESESCEGDYYLENVQSSQYLAVLYGRIRAPYVISMNARGVFARLHIRDLGNDEYAIGSTYYEDRWMCVGGDGRGVTSCQTIGRAGRWRIEARRGNADVYEITSVDNDRYWTWNGRHINDGEYTVRLTNDNRGAASRWRLIEPATLAEKKKNLRSASA